MRDDLVSRRAVMDSLCAEYNRRYAAGETKGLRLAWIEKAVSDTPPATQNDLIRALEDDLK